MATYCPEDLTSRELSCPICFEDYDIQDTRRAPKLLLCLHTFCFDCARKLWKNDGSLECSLCRMLHQEVKLDDLLDNHVIVQHLRREFEMRDLEFARRIDEELRQQESIASPAGASEVNRIIQEPVVLELSCSSPDIAVADIGADQNETVEIGDDTEEEEEEEQEQEQEEEEEEDRQYSLSTFIEGIMEGLADEEGEDANNSYEEPEEIEQEQQEGEEEESDTDREEEENTNSFFSFHNIHALFDPSAEESEEETRDENTNDMFIENLVHTVFENEADEEDEDERWHSASDDINVACFEGSDALRMHEVQDMEDDTPDIFDWHIITSENLFDD